MYYKVVGFLIVYLTSFFCLNAQTSKIQSSVSNSYITIIMCLGDEVTLDGDEGEDSYYEWSTGEYEKTITIYEPGKYEVIITKEEDINFIGKKTFYVKGAAGPAINRVFVMDDNKTLKVFTREDGNYEYSANGKDFQSSNIFENLKNGPHEFFVRDTDSCQAVGPVFRFIKL